MQVRTGFLVLAVTFQQINNAESNNMLSKWEKQTQWQFYLSFPPFFFLENNLIIQLSSIAFAVLLNCSKLP